MLTISYPVASAGCRRGTVPACDPTSASVGTNPPPVATLTVKAGDIIDVGLDWAEWLAGNAGEIDTTVWAAHGSSPQAPTIVAATASLHDVEAKATLCLLDLTAAAVGNTYWLENTVVMKGVPSGSFTMPSRTLKRVLYVKVVL